MRLERRGKLSRVSQYISIVSLVGSITNAFSEASMGAREEFLVIFISLLEIRKKNKHKFFIFRLKYIDNVKHAHT